VRGLCIYVLSLSGLASGAQLPRPLPRSTAAWELPAPTVENLPNAGTWWIRSSGSKFGEFGGGEVEGRWGILQDFGRKSDSTHHTYRSEGPI
jgi:hypothetical protein